jgi:hypothetical protein
VTVTVTVTLENLAITPGRSTLWWVTVTVTVTHQSHVQGGFVAQQSCLSVAGRSGVGRLGLGRCVGGRFFPSVVQSATVC